MSEAVNQLDILWQYQQEDIKADRLSAEIKSSPARKKLESTRDLILDKQSQAKKLDEKISAITDRVDIIRDALPRCEDQLKKLADSLTANPPADTSAAAAMLQEATNCRSSIASFESELRSLEKSLTEALSVQRKLCIAAVQAKKEFDTLKVPYDAELKTQKEKLATQRAVAAKLAENVDPALLQHYAQVKKRVSPPLCHLNGNQCGGCFTSLAAAQLARIRNGERIECENCGRIIIG